MLFQSLHEQLNLDSDVGTAEGQVQKRGATNASIVLNLSLRRLYGSFNKNWEDGEEWLVNVQFY